jgi:hypothetical protein
MDKIWKCLAIAAAGGPDAALRGPAPRGPALRGPALRGPALRGPALRGPALRVASARTGRDHSSAITPWLLQLARRCAGSNSLDASYMPLTKAGSATAPDSRFRNSHGKNALNRGCRLTATVHAPWRGIALYGPLAVISCLVHKLLGDNIDLYLCRRPLHR